MLVRRILILGGNQFNPLIQSITTPKKQFHGSDDGGRRINLPYGLGTEPPKTNFMGSDWMVGWWILGILVVVILLVLVAKEDYPKALKANLVA